MMPKSLLSLLLLLAAAALTLDLIGAGKAHAPLPPMFAEKLTFAQAEARSKETGKPVFAVFSATWCGPCQAYKRAALSDARVADFVKQNFIPAYVDVDENGDIAKRYSISSIPSTGVFKDGKRKLGAIGAKPADELLTWMKEGLEKAAK